MNLYRVDNPTQTLWVGTQAEAKAAAKEGGGSWELIDFPVSKAELLLTINEMQVQPSQLIPVVLEGETAPVILQPTETVECGITIEEQIMDSTGATFGRYLSAAIERLGELRAEGWNSLLALRKQHKGAPGDALVRGIGFLVLGASE